MLIFKESGNCDLLLLPSLEANTQGVLNPQDILVSFQEKQRSYFNQRQRKLYPPPNNASSCHAMHMHYGAKEYLLAFFEMWIKFNVRFVFTY